MKRKTLWLAAVGTIFVMFMMFTTMASAGVSEWTYGVPVLTGEAGTFTGNEAMVTMTGTIKKIEPMRGVKDGLQMRFTEEGGGKWSSIWDPNGSSRIRRLNSPRVIKLKSVEKG